VKVSELEPIVPFRPRDSGGGPEAYETRNWTGPPPQQVAFDRRELNLILAVYGEKVAAGEWRDYAIDFGRDSATFSVFRRASEVPLYRIVKDPSLARKQGAYSVVAQGGYILKRGHDLAQVLKALLKRPKLFTI
jgi:hypothetical protein